MNILLTNDDGIFAEGIYELAKELEKYHNVILVAPHIENSAKSHSITIYKPLDIEKVELEGLKSEAYSVTGTPADCSRIALGYFLKDKNIDLVISGINLGLNVGMDVLYSGTVSAAIEANIQGYPAIAVSTEYKNGHCSFIETARLTKELIDNLELKNELTKDLILNFNTPSMLSKEDLKGIKVSKLGGGLKDEYTLIEEEKTEDVIKSFRIIGREKRSFIEGTDRYYIEEGYAVITPLSYNFTNVNLLDEMKYLEK